MNTLACNCSLDATVDFHELVRQVHAVGKQSLAAHAESVDREARFPTEAFAALREAKLLSAYVPTKYGGMGLNISQIAELCEVLGQYCGSSAMIYAMHCIQVACVVRHGQQSAYFRDYLRQLAEQQLLMASATTEIGTGGDLLSSLCAVETHGDRFKLTKQAPVISYGLQADDILVTCRRSPESPASDQVHVMVRRGEFTAIPLSTWDTMGFRGTCSSGFTLTAEGDAAQILPVSFTEILTETMHPYSHIVWGALWSGIAMDAVNRARAFVRVEARKTPGETPISAIRLAEVDQVLQEMRHNVKSLTREYQDLLEQNCSDAFKGFGFSIRTNNLKVSCSQRIVDIVSKALLICGISGYRNDSKFSLARHLRDSYGAALMVNNDRITKLNATMLMVHKEGH
ncbi:acyl-CoA dehydrogenase family protein [Schlesneria paludicola]|uniref:acyl-CoA dehydrogenase family protein n=1 Tax=Schlesneria paludicola TaxID=360056 RepID=UPI00029A928E|nr:acyl-CoA dehydrogenase family protein [Schlesneria paludicola]